MKHLAEKFHSRGRRALVGLRIAGVRNLSSLEKLLTGLVRKHVTHGAEAASRTLFQGDYFNSGGRSRSGTSGQRMWIYVWAIPRSRSLRKIMDPLQDR
jgi:hypothetical protein